jgi:protein-serine/threonine kinase
LFEVLSNHHAELAQREWLVRILFGQLANAVGWMHSINLVHRDIKLENILLTRHFFPNDNLQPSTLSPSGPLIKISDFGLSRFIDPNSPLLETRCGSEEYAAPELIIGKRYDGRKTDVWAMGVVLYALLSGSLPFLSHDVLEQDQGINQSFGRGYPRERGVADQSALARKAHLLRIAKGDLRWPMETNESSLDKVQPPCPSTHRLITPLARRLVARLLRRDAAKRATAWEAWDEEWLTMGSIHNESSLANSDTAASEVAPVDPRSEVGQAWLKSHSKVQSGASKVTLDD